MAANTLAKLEPGTIYEGVVVGNLLPNNTVAVRIMGFGTDIPCQTSFDIIFGLLGFKTSGLLPLQTKVLILYRDANLSYVLRTLPPITVDPGHQARNTVGSDAPNYQTSQVFAARNTQQAPMAAGQKPPVDLAEGEFEIANQLGVALKMLRGLAGLSAGDLAKVECHLLDNMVRIVSDTFRHYTAFGDFKVVNDGGKLNVVWHGTSAEHEAWGLPLDSDPRVAMDPATKQIDMRSVDGVLDDGRWRFSQYVGWLGNFINLFVTDPVNAVGKIAAGQFRSGKFRAHVNNDGSFLLQSVADIVLEKVVRIPVPNPLRLEDDPAGNRSNDLPRGEENLKNWNPSNADNLFEMVFQLREYARWLNNTYSLARFQQLDRDFELPTEAQTPAPDLNNGELDKLKANRDEQGRTTSNWRIAYSTIRIYRDGSYQQVDAYGNATTTTAIGYHISTPRDLYLEAGGSINLAAGRDINLLARQNVGITAANQAVRLAGKTGVMVLAQAGHLVLEVMGNFVTKVLGTLNLANKIELNANGKISAQGDIGTTGDLNALGNVNALRVTAADTMYADDHYGHIYPGGPGAVSVGSVNASFAFQSSYGTGTLYQSLSQQALAAGEQAAAGVWQFSTNAVVNKGSPWPGAGAEFLQPAGGESLQRPSGQAAFSRQPQAMVAGPVAIHYQL